MTLEQQILSGLSHHRAGRLSEAEKIYRQALEREPNHAEALHLLGMVAAQSGQLEAAAERIRRAIAQCPGNPVYHGNLGKVLEGMGRLNEAIASYRQGIALRSDLAELHNNLGNALAMIGDYQAAVAACGEAIRLRPNFAGAHYNLGIALKNMGRIDEAVSAYRQAIRLQPGFAEAYNNLGNVLKEFGQLEDAIASYRQVIRLKPEHAIAHNNLGTALMDLGSVTEAEEAFRRAIQIKPDYSDAHFNLGVALQFEKQTGGAIDAYRQAIRYDKDFAAAYNNLGNMLVRCGQIAEAIDSYRQAIRINPKFIESHSNLIFACHYDPEYDAARICEELRLWDQRHADPVKRLIRPHSNNRNLDRRLKIGYVSPDFRDNVVGRLLLPLFREHDPGEVEVFCYSNSNKTDSLTGQLRNHSNHWHVITRVSDAEAADLIRRDEVDILVDLALHTSGNRLRVFAYKPAPVQVSYLAYCSSTGLETMDYRFTDPYLDPPGIDDSYYSEQSIYLPETYWCYPARAESPVVGPLPLLRTGVITFGCLNNFAKVSQPALDLFAEILRKVDRSRLILHCYPGAHLDGIREWFEQNSISRDRLEFVGEKPWIEYARTYERIDIALDPFPWAGGITTCDALWMGVPVATLAGRMAVGRGGVSILSNIGLTDLIAPDAQRYVQTAIDLAAELPRLAELRGSMRARMLKSPLMDAPRFARDVEAAYRQIWRNYCAG